LLVFPADLWAGDSARIVVTGRGALPLRVVSPSGKTSNVALRRVGRARREGMLRLDEPGRWRLHLVGTAVRRQLAVRPQMPQPPAGFARLGRDGCAPPSPTGSQSGIVEAFGTAVRGRLWALYFLDTSSLSGDGTSTFDGLAGRRLKVVFRWSGLTFPVVAIAPDGSRHTPVSGPTVHGSSTWMRPGNEWGTIFEFAMPGCWRIHVESQGASGDVWLLIRS
jgi:hypothetical protein